MYRDEETEMEAAKRSGGEEDRPRRSVCCASPHCSQIRFLYFLQQHSDSAGGADVIFLGIKVRTFQ